MIIVIRELELKLRKLKHIQQQMSAAVYEIKKWKRLMIEWIERNRTFKLNP